MPRYIDADALKAKYEQMIPEIGDGYHKETLQDVLFELEYAPTISPDEVRGRENAKLENSVKLLVAAFDLAKEKLQKYRHAAFVISETCVDESKGHISPEDAIKKIREHIYYDNTASCSDPLEEVV